MFLAKEHAIVLVNRLLIGRPRDAGAFKLHCQDIRVRERLNSRRIGAPEFGSPWSIQSGAGEALEPEPVFSGRIVADSDIWPNMASNAPRSRNTGAYVRPGLADKLLSCADFRISRSHSPAA